MRKTRHPRHALRRWANLGATVRKIETLFVLSDYDGTLVPIASRPGQARLADSTRALLHRLNALPAVQLGIISGRALRDVRRLVRIPRVFYIGNHGSEILGPNVHFVHPQVRRSRPLLRRVAGQLERSLSVVRGAQVESKGLSLSVHWRRVAARNLPRFRRLLHAVLGPWASAGKIRLTRGKCVIEVRAPVAWDKGSGIAWLTRHAPHTGRVGVCYLGDDRTDEDAFRAVNRLRGVSIVVGPGRRRTRARWWLRDPSEVHELLARILTVRSNG